MALFGDIAANTNVKNIGGHETVSATTLTVSASSITFSALLGNTDEIYTLEIDIKNGPLVNNVFFRPNGLTTNLRSQIQTWDGTADGFTVSTTVIEIGRMLANGTSSCNVVIHAKQNPGGSTRVRQVISQGGHDGDLGFVGHGEWRESATELTSIEITSDQPTGFAPGTTAILGRRRVA